VNRQLQDERVTFMLLELGGPFHRARCGSHHERGRSFRRSEVAGMPMSIVLQYGVPLLMVPVLMAFKYGKPRATFAILLAGT